MKNIFYFFLFALIIGSCTSSQNISKSNLSELYRRGNRLIEPKYSIYHSSTDSSEVNFMINTKDLLYSKDGQSDEYIGKINISYTLFKAFESNEMVDSASTEIVDRTNKIKSKNIYGSLKIKVSYPNHYLLKVIATDVYRKQKVESYIEIDKGDRYNRQNFKVLSLENDLPIFKNYLENGETVKIVFNNLSNKKKIRKYFYKRNFDVAPPPFSVYNPKPFDYLTDSESIITLTPKNSFVFTPKERGFYHFSADTSSSAGLTLYQFAPGFPDINDVDELVSALRFITSKKEFKEMNASEDKKKVLDEFWLKAAHSKVRARELIRSYYNRVQNANYFFSSFKEGWKTDRGIIYIVFGPPSVVYKSSGAEAWVYGEQSNYLSVTFNFNKANNPFSNNDFQLSRSPIYKNQWYRNVDAWRQGRVSTLEY